MYLKPFLDLTLGLFSEACLTYIVVMMASLLALAMSLEIAAETNAVITCHFYFTEGISGAYLFQHILNLILSLKILK